LCIQLPKDQLLDDLKVLVDHRDQLGSGACHGSQPHSQEHHGALSGLWKSLSESHRKNHLAAVIRLLPGNSSVRADLVRRHVKNSGDSLTRLPTPQRQIEGKVNNTS